MSSKSAQIGTSITQTATVTTASTTKRATVEVSTILATNLSLTQETAVAAKIAMIPHVLIKMTKQIPLEILAQSGISRMQPQENPVYARNSIGVKRINLKLREIAVFVVEGKLLEWTISDSLKMSKSPSQCFAW